MVDIQTALTYLTLISIPVGVAYHIMTLNNTRKNQQIQLETRQAQLYTTLWNQSFNNSDWMKNYLIIDRLTWTTFEQYNELFPYSDHTSENTLAVWKVSMFFEALSPIIKKDLIDLSFFFPTFYGLLRSFWLKIEQILPEAREHFGPRMWTESEYVYNVLTAYLKKNPSLWPYSEFLVQTQRDNL